jgi:hypothetical protein
MSLYNIAVSVPQIAAPLAYSVNILDIGESKWSCLVSSSGWIDSFGGCIDNIASGGELKIA